MNYLTEEKLKDFRDKFGDLFHYINMVDWIENEINEAVIKVSRVDAEVKPACELCKYWGEKKHEETRLCQNNEGRLFVGVYTQPKFSCADFVSKSV